MITAVADIIAAAKAEIQTHLDTSFPPAGTYKQLDYEHDLAENSFASHAQRYGFIPAEAVFNTSGALRAVTLDHVFQIILTTDFANQDDDAPQRAALNTLYEASNDLLRKLINRKLGLPGTVLLVSGSAIDPPEFFDDNGVCALRTNLTVRYRYGTS